PGADGLVDHGTALNVTNPSPGASNMSIHTLMLRIVSATAAMTILGLLAGEANAAFVSRPFFSKIRGKAVAMPNKEPQNVPNEQLHEALHALRNINHTLKGADHDYGGHRAAAIKSIGQAEHQLKLALEHHHKKAGSGAAVKKPKGTGEKGEPEPQALSDAQLAAAVPMLKNVANLLAHADHDYGGHREKAVKDIGVAVVDLEKALKFSKEKNAGKP